MSMKTARKVPTKNAKSSDASDSPTTPPIRALPTRRQKWMLVVASVAMLVWLIILAVLAML